MAKYLKINGKVCLDTWQGMLTSQKRRISALRCEQYGIYGWFAFHSAIVVALNHSPISLLSVPVLWNIGI